MYCCCWFAASKANLRLGADTLNFAELQRRSRKPSGGNPDPIVILMACGNADQQAAWQALLATTTATFSGVVANETLLSASRAFEVGHAIAQRFVQGPAGLGEILQTLRQEGVGAAWRSARSVRLRCAWLRKERGGRTGSRLRDRTAAVAANHPTGRSPLLTRPTGPSSLAATWTRCIGALLLDQAETRGVFLHGSPAIGKTSYLRAGLLPLLEQESVGYSGLARSLAAGDSQLPRAIIRC